MLDEKYNYQVSDWSTFITGEGSLSALGKKSWQKSFWDIHPQKIEECPGGPLFPNYMSFLNDHADSTNGINIVESYIYTSNSL